MTLILKSQPTKTINGLISEPNAALTQLPFVFQRQDFTWYSNDTDASTGNFRILLSAVFGDIRNEFTAGDLIFLAMPENYLSKGYTGFFEVLSVNYSAPYTRIVTTEPPKAGTPGAVVEDTLNNLTTRAGYRVNMRINDPDGSQLFPIDFFYQTRPNGSLFVDLGRVLKDYMNTARTLSQLFTLEYWETWDGNGKTNPFAPVPIIVLTDNGGTIQVQADTTNIIVGNYYLVTSTFYPGIVGKATAVDYGAQLIDFDIPFSQADSGGTVGPVGTAESALQSQAVYARLDNYAEFGSNMYKNLLRPGGGTPEANFYWLSGDSTTVKQVGSGSESNWTNFSNGITSRPANGTNTVTKTLYPLTQGFIAKGTPLHLEYSARLQVTSFVSAADINTQFFGLKANGGADLLASFTDYNVSGNLGQVDFGRIYTGGFALTDYVAIGFRFVKTGGDFIADIIFNGNGATGSLINFKTPYQIAELLTRFENPLVWRGWARRCSFLSDSGLDGRINAPLRSVIQTADINKTLGATNVTLNRSGTTPGIYETDIYDQGGAFVAHRMTETDASLYVSNQLFYRVLDPCSNPVCVRWLNSLGGFDEHLFSVSQLFQGRADVGTVISTPVETDLYNEKKSTKQRIDIDGVQRVYLTAENLTRDQFEALKEIKYSEYVLVYLTKDGSETVQVIAVSDLRDEIDTDAGPWSYTVLLEFPDNVDFFKAKKY